jgi:hypothetical protein
VAGACSRGSSRAPRRSVSCVSWAAGARRVLPIHPRRPPPRRRWGLVLGCRPAGVGGRAVPACPPGWGDTVIAGGPLSEDGSAVNGVQG